MSEPSNRTSLRLRAPLAAVAEIAVTVRCGMFPFARLRPMPRLRPRGDRTPVLMVHGFFGHRDMLRPLERRLRKEGWGQIVRLNYPSIRLDLEEVVARIAAEAVPLAQHGPIDVVGHSLGAVALRAWIKELDGARHVRRFVSLGGPHAGTALYRFVPPRVRPSLDPRGEWAERLAVGDEPVPTTVIRSSWDQNVLPPSRGRIRGVRDIVIRTHGHNGLLWSREAHNAVIDALTESLD